MNAALESECSLIRRLGNGVFLPREIRLFLPHVDGFVSFDEVVNGDPSLSFISFSLSSWIEGVSRPQFSSLSSLPFISGLALFIFLVCEGNEISIFEQGLSCQVNLFRFAGCCVPGDSLSGHKVGKCEDNCEFDSFKAI